MSEIGIAIVALPVERGDEFSIPISTNFGIPYLPERAERGRSLTELDVRLGAFDGDTIVGAAGAFTFDMTVPGGVPVEISGLTMVAVLPTHRRRGILRSLMRRHLDDAHARGQCLAGLFASEGSIYGRFGYGIASLSGEIDLTRDHAAFARPVEPRGRVRLLGESEAEAAFPPIWDRVRLETPGMLSRSPSWWHWRRTMDAAWLRGGRGPLQRALLEIDGRPAAYALYRFSVVGGPGVRDMPIEVTEAMGDSPAAVRAMWRYLLDIDFASRFTANHVPVDHPLFFLLAEGRRLQMKLSDGLWMRLVDVGAALSRRRYAGDGRPLVIDLQDGFCPWNTGRWRIEDGRAERTHEDADLALDAETLGSLYLGGFSFSQMARAARVEERRPGALLRADAMFRSDRAPWCPETF